MRNPDRSGSESVQHVRGAAPGGAEAARAAESGRAHVVQASGSIVQRGASRHLVVRLINTATHKGAECHRIYESQRSEWGACPISTLVPYGTLRLTVAGFGA